MTKVKNRILNYLLARQYRAARHEAFERTAEVGILNRDNIGENERSGSKWRFADNCALEFTGDDDHDFELITKYLKRSSCRTHPSDIVIEAEMSSEFCEDINSEEADHTGAVINPPSTGFPKNDVILPSTQKQRLG